MEFTTLFMVSLEVPLFKDTKTFKFQLFTATNGTLEAQYYEPESYLQDLVGSIEHNTFLIRLRLQIPNLQFFPVLSYHVSVSVNLTENEVLFTCVTSTSMFSITGHGVRKTFWGSQGASTRFLYGNLKCARIHAIMLAHQ